MKDKGFVKIDRDVFDTDLWKEPRRFSRFEAWCDILRRMSIYGTNGICKGEVFISLRKTAIRWGWDKDTVARFLSQLVTLGMLGNTGKQSVYTVKTYGDSKRDTKRDNDGDNDGDTKRGKRQRIKQTHGDSNGDTQRDSNGDSKCDTPPILNKEKKENKDACACAREFSPSPAPAAGVTDDKWRRFQEWAAEHIPTIAPGITKTGYVVMRENALNDMKLMARLLEDIEKSGRVPHKVEDEFRRRLKEWRGGWR